MVTAKAKPKSGKTTKGAAAKKIVSRTAPKPTAKRAPPKVAKKPAAKVAAKAKPVAKKPAPKVKVAAKAKVKVPPKAAPKAKAKPQPKAKSAAKPAPKVTPKATAKAAPKATVKASPKAPPKTTSKVTGTPVSTAKTTPAAAPKTKVSAKVDVKPMTKTNEKFAAPMPPAPAPRPIVRTVTKPAPIVTVTHSTVKVAGLLSEAEIVKQAKTDYMSRQQLAFFKHRLLALQSELRENAGATTEHLRELAVAPDPADRATLEEEHALELRTRDRERKLLKKVEAALVRIEDGSYGYCEETGDPIGIQRLIARPTATLTIEAQERREMKQKMYGE